MTRGASVVSPTAHPLYQAWGNSDIPMNKKLFGLIALILYACSGLTACSDDDDDNDSNSALVGTWEITHRVDWNERYGGDYNPEAWQDYSYAGERLKFNSDGTYIGYSCDPMYNDYNWEEYAHDKYKYSDGKLTIRQDGETYTATVDKLTKTTLEITGIDYEPYKTIQRLRYKRVE